MGNMAENEDGVDDIPRDTQLDKQYIETPSNKENQESQDYQMNQMNTSNQNYALMQGEEKYGINQEDIQYQNQQETQGIQSNIGTFHYEISDINEQYENNQGIQGGVEQGELVQENQENEKNEEIEENQEDEEMEANQDVEEKEEMEANQEIEENQEMEAIQEMGANQIMGANQEIGANQVMEVNQEMETNQLMEADQELEANQEIEENQEAEDNQEDEENQEVEDEENQEIEDNQEVEENQEIEDNQEVENQQVGEDIQEVGDNQGIKQKEQFIENNELIDINNIYKLNQIDNNQITKENKAYIVNQNGETYKVNEELKQYQMNSNDNNYQIKKEYKMTKIEKVNENNQNNSDSQGEGHSKENSSKMSIKGNLNILPKDSIPKVIIQSSGNINSPSKVRYTQYYGDIPKYMSFKKSNINKNLTNVNSNVKVEKIENISDLVEIPRSEYENYIGRETIVIGEGMDTGEYKFRGQGIVITQAQVPVGKIVISEEDILKEINRRKNKPKKEKKRKYEVLDRFYAITEFDGKPIKKIEKVEQQQKQQYEYNEQYYSSSNGNKAYQFSSKESKSNGIINEQLQSNIDQQFQSQQLQFQKSLQLNSQNPQLKNQQQTQNKGIKINFSYNKNNENKNTSNLKYNNLSLSFQPPDNYSKYLFEQINELRADPQSYIRIIEKAKNNIINDKHGRLIYNGKIKIGLTVGESAFNNAIDFLKTIKPMEKLVYNPYITVDLPKSENELKYKNDLRLKVENMINNGININSYWKDVIKDPQISFLMMIVDDNGNNSGMKRKDLLSPDMKYIGINSIEINGNFVCYITLSRDE